MHSSRCLLVISAVLGFAGWSGCRPDSGLRTVHGTITIEGAPLETGMIQFVRIEEPPTPAGGAVIAHGKYSIPSGHGLAPGRYKVQINSPEVSSAPAAQGPDLMRGAKAANRERIAPEFNVESRLEVEVVRDGPNEFNFEVK